VNIARVSNIKIMRRDSIKEIKGNAHYSLVRYNNQHGRKKAMADKKI
jgi:hypothetical protein